MVSGPGHVRVCGPVGCAGLLGLLGDDGEDPPLLLLLRLLLVRLGCDGRLFTAQLSPWSRLCMDMPFWQCLWQRWLGVPSVPCSWKPPPLQEWAHTGRSCCNQANTAIISTSAATTAYKHSLVLGCRNRADITGAFLCVRVSVSACHFKTRPPSSRTAIGQHGVQVGHIGQTVVAVIPEVLVGQRLA